MNKIIQRIALAKHIVVIADINPNAGSLGSASAMYTYILQQHKKVSFFSVSSQLNKKFSFLPWFEKIRTSFPSSADLAITLGCSSYEQIGANIECDVINIDYNECNTNFGKINLVDFKAISTAEIVYSWFKTNDIAINKKMATSLYAAILNDSNGFLSAKVNENTFEISKNLLQCKADSNICNEFIINYKSLAGLRLKAIMLSKMQLIFNAQIALFLVSEEEIKSAGAEVIDCRDVLEESLGLPTVKISVLLREGRNMAKEISLYSQDKQSALRVASFFDSTSINFTVNSDNSILETANKIIEIIQREI